MGFALSSLTLQLPLPFSVLKVPTNRRQRTATSQFDTDAEDLAVESDVPCTVADIRDVEHDHSYSLVADDDHQCHRNELQEPEKTKSVGCQTEISLFDLEEWEKEKRRLRCEIKNLQDRLSNKAKLKRELFMEDVLKNDDCVKFYTGIPTLGCFNMLTDLITPEAEKLKYWDKNKEKQMKYHTSPGNKPGPKRILTIKEEFVITLVRLRLGLMGRHLAHVFSVSQSQLSRIFTTWVCFLASIFKNTLVCWPSKE